MYLTKLLDFTLKIKNQEIFKYQELPFGITDGPINL